MSKFNASTMASTDVNTDQTEDNFDPPPIGQAYEVVITDASAFSSKAGDADYVKLHLQVATGPQQGYSWVQMFGFKNEGAYKAVKGTCMRIGVDLEGVSNLQELDTLLKACVGNWYAMDVAANPKDERYPRQYFGDRLDARRPVSDPAAEFQPVASGAGSQDDDDSIPF